jgi:hypothetical protein
VDRRGIQGDDEASTISDEDEKISLSEGPSLKAKAFLNQLESKGPDLELTKIDEDVEMDCSTSSVTSEYRILNKKIDRAEAHSKNKGRELISSKQEVIRCYYKFGQVMSTRLEELKKIHPNKIHPNKSSRNILSREIKKKLNDVSSRVIKKRIRTARIIYEIFSVVGYEKIRLTTFTASSIGTFTDDDIK